MNKLIYSVAAVITIMAIMIFMLISIQEYVPAKHFHVWNSIYDPYMKTEGYALNETRDIINKNGIEIIQFSDCYRCDPEIELVPSNLYDTLVTDFNMALTKAQKDYDNDLLTKLNIVQTGVNDESTK